jgi:ABC-2 type transport system permease protein
MRASAIREALGLFGLNSRIVLMRGMAYRLDFALSIAVSLGFSAIGPLFQFFLYRKSNGYPGWTWDQILVFQAVLLLLNGLCETLFGSMRGQIDALMQNGEFDRLLLKPRAPLLLILTGGFTPSGLGALIAGIAATAWACARSGLPGGAAGLLLFPAFVAARILLQMSAHIVYCVLTVRWVYTMRLAEIIDKILNWGNYPLEVFPKAARLAFSTVLPFSVACYWPAKALLGPLGWLALSSLGGTAALFVICLALWRAQLRRYASGGG